jgi:hypothetical protein
MENDDINKLLTRLEDEVRQFQEYYDSAVADARSASDQVNRLRNGMPGHQQRMGSEAQYLQQLSDLQVAMQSLAVANLVVQQRSEALTLRRQHLETLRFIARGYASITEMVAAWRRYLARFTGPDSPGSELD